MGKKPIRVIAIRRVAVKGSGSYSQAAIYQATPREIDGVETFRPVEAVGPLRRTIKKLTVWAKSQAVEMGVPFSEVVRNGMSVEEWEQGGRK